MAAADTKNSTQRWEGTPVENVSASTVLVVEDNPAMNNAICDILELNSYRVRSAHNGQEALNYLQTERPDVILCDIMMPHMDGYTLLRHTRADERLRTLPFIFLTARSSEDDRRQAKTIGIEDYLVKPVDPEDLTIAVENALRRSRNLAIETQSQMDSLRNQIVRTLQHEFRTPLTFILGYAEYLAEIADDQIDLETLKLSTHAILEGGHRLQDLVEKFLLLADIQYRQHLPGREEHLSAHQMLKNATSNMTKAAAEVSMEILVEPAPESDTIIGEISYLYRAVIHMIENSIQYRRPQSKQIWLSVAVAENYIGLRVADDGKGISPTMLQLLQRPFEQVKRDDRTVPGAGLSLALIQHIARLHGGYLEIESEEGKGSTFTLWLPRPLSKKAAEHA
jgi:two-component system, sensor histidine kinase and response regulator